MRADGRAADARRRSGRRRPLGDDVPARDGAASSSALIRALKPGVRVVAGGYDPEPRARGLRGPGVGRRLHRPRRRRAHVPRAAARARTRRDAGRRDRRACRIRDGSRFRPQPGRGRSAARRRRDRAAQPRARACSTATRCSAGRSTSSRRRAAAPSTAASARSSRCAAATSTPSASSACSPTSPTRARAARAAIFLVDDNITLDVAAVRGAVPARSSTPASTTSTTSCRR